MLADKAYQGADRTVRVPYRGRWDKLSVGQQAVNRSHAKIRALGEQAMATIKSWRLLRKLRCSTNRITDIVKAGLPCSSLPQHEAGTAQQSCGKGRPQPHQRSALTMADVRVTYDKKVDAAYVYFIDPQAPAKAARMYPCDPVGGGGMINLDFDEQHRLISIEVLAARSKLPKHLLEVSRAC